MDVITRRLSVTELSQRIIEMAKTGVYRESVFEAFQPLATKKQIREAIAHAKRFGLHSVANLRDAELGTYYQVDWIKYESLQDRLHSPVHLGNDTDLIQRVTDATTAVQRMLAIAKGLTIALGLTSILGFLGGQEHVGFGLLSATIGATVVWQWQHWLLRSVTRE
ncbi:hypothetical protein ACN4EK_07455 [Pantanalinema rosaneae CENA516]|uniref:hypothetical protein n=1 Tax=Pantanalinema rosaneae TaxID=1620701 RepID=UPI003D6FCA55